MRSSLSERERWFVETVQGMFLSAVLEQSLPCPTPQGHQLFSTILEATRGDVSNQGHRR